jgi:hypothetical protein
MTRSFTSSSHVEIRRENSGFLINIVRGMIPIAQGECKLSPSNRSWGLNKSTEDVEGAQSVLCSTAGCVFRRPYSEKL